MPYLSPKLQLLRETDKRKKIADRSFNVLTNTPILNLNPKGVHIEGLTTKLKTELAKLSFEDFGLMCKNEAIRRMMARLLETNVEINVNKLIQCLSFIKQKILKYFNKILLDNFNKSFY
jgi:hypothetical protein